jgi:hypothetical protein
LPTPPGIELPPEAWRPLRLVGRHERDREGTTPLSSAAAVIPDVLAFILGAAKTPGISLNRGNCAGVGLLNERSRAYSAAWSSRAGAGAIRSKLHG